LRAEGEAKKGRPKGRRKVSIRLKFLIASTGRFYLPEVCEKRVHPRNRKFGITAFTND